MSWMLQNRLVCYIVEMERHCRIFKVVRVLKRSQIILQEILECDVNQIIEGFGEKYFH